ncbi:transglutaminase-like cysteine peptidase [Pokkaliibacter sp. MBI-7]|uniref:transglutaminase-like cysteine peptidase n=1 Tax=Pokkaliibacter sp. MBI-7 TaxID=3040600 RepID=UPI00244B9DB7|nr:transglutaminase-like cysteine peptidase [Pokkaliibacter sp. MBI-7]MDH2433293.1 transglutaminase-like cysteine peptidase [Pokkaliibacter sp. MBI-7]
MLIRAVLLCLLLLPMGWLMAAYSGFSSVVLQRVESQYGAAAKRRVLDWEGLMTDSTLLKAQESTKLRAVNDFFNKVRWLDDLTVWGKNDYWATPLEFLERNAGDCEDFSIAKYFTLRELGVPESKLRIMYVKALAYNQAHMVLLYYASPSAMPVVLDNINPKIEPASKRTDLVPVYSFNGSGLWLNNSPAGQKVGTSDRIGPWRDLLARLQQERR